jgi:hypothetical protein
MYNLNEINKLRLCGRVNQSPAPIRQSERIFPINGQIRLTAGQFWPKCAAAHRRSVVDLPIDRENWPCPSALSKYSINAFWVNCRKWGRFSTSVDNRNKSAKSFRLLISMSSLIFLTSYLKLHSDEPYFTCVIITHVVVPVSGA